MPELTEEPTSPHELEDYVAALFQSAGFFVEKNITESDPTDVLELDIVATDYAHDIPESSIAEAKSGGWGFNDIFKVAGWMRYLGLRRGAFFVSKHMQGRDPAWVASKVEPMGLKFIHLGDFSQVVAAFESTGLGSISEPAEIHFWRWSHHIERKVTGELRPYLKGDPPSPAALAVRKYHRLVNDGIFFLSDIRERIAALYEAYQEHPRLSVGCALELEGKTFDPTADYGGKLITEAMREGKHPLLQASFYVEHRARLAILQSAIDLACHHPDIVSQLHRRSPEGFKYLVLPQLPHSFREGLEWLCAQPTFKRYALLWQVLLWGCGGFYLEDRQDDEYGWLSDRTRVPVGEIPVALMAFDKFFPAGAWLTTAGMTKRSSR